MKILLTNVYDLFNKGEVALVTSLVKNLPNSEFMVAPLYSFLDIKFCIKLGVTVYGSENPRHIFLLPFWFMQTLFRALLWSFLHKFSISLNFLLNKELRAYSEANLIVDLGGDNFSDDYGVVGTCVHSYSLFLGLIFNKQYFICSQSIGPFKTPFTRFLAKFILNRARMITVREPITFCYLLNDLKIKVGNRLRIVPDLAFLLEEVEREEIQKFLMKKGIPFDERPKICVNPSQLISRYMFPNINDGYESYIVLMANIIDGLPNNSVVLLIPNVIARPVQVLGPFKNVDDRLAIKAIFEKIKDKSRVYIINELDVHQIKGMIGISDLFIGCRMHAIISALSVGTPTIGLSYSHKTMGMGELLGLKEFLVDVRHRNDLDAVRHELLTKINNVWNNRLTIREMLQKKREEWESMAMMNINLIWQVCQCESR